MKIFSFFKKAKTQQNLDEYTQLKDFNNFIVSLKDSDCYISKSNYKNQIEKFANTYLYFNSLCKSLTLKSFCKRTHINEKVATAFIEDYQNINEIIESINQNFLTTHLSSDKRYLDNIFNSCDSKVILDEEQRRVVLSDEDYTLVIAGAGAGKTTTVAAKVKYLVDKKNIDPGQILVISFTNKAVEELKERINRDLGIPCPISTFHSAGLAILRNESGEKKNVAGEGLLYNSILKTIKSRMANESLTNNLLLFFSSYFNVPYEGEDVNIFFNQIVKSDFSTLKGNISEYAQNIINKVSKKRDNKFGDSPILSRSVYSKFHVFKRNIL